MRNRKNKTITGEDATTIFLVVVLVFVWVAAHNCGGF